MDASGAQEDSEGRAADGRRRSRNVPGAGDVGRSREASELPLHNAPAMLTHLGGQLAWQARMVEVNDQLEQRLGRLDRSEWLQVRGLALDSVEVPIPWMLFGPSGVFMLQASRGHWIDGDIDLMSRAATALGGVIRDYPDPVRPCIVIIDGGAQERQHFAGMAHRGAGPCWIVSDGRLLPWLLRFRDQGFSEGDIARLRALADPARIRETEHRILPRGGGHSGSAPQDYYFPG
jgi:hypothetical protein